VYDQSVTELSNPVVLILFVLTMIVISLSVISIRIQKSVGFQKKTFEQNQIKSSAEYASIGVFFQGERTLIKCLDCAELISLEAKICKHCGTNVEGHVSQVKTKMVQFEEKRAQLKKQREELEIQQRADDLRYYKKIGIAFAIVITVFVGGLFVTPIVKGQFFPTKIQTLAEEWKVAFAECGSKDIKIIFGYKSEDTYENYPSAIEARVDLTSAGTRKCLSSKLDNVYAKFNTQGNRFASTWAIGDYSSGKRGKLSKEDWEAFTVFHKWIGAEYYVSNN
jgi:hypothetical protein